MGNNNGIMNVVLGNYLKMLDNYRLCKQYFKYYLPKKLN